MKSLCFLLALTLTKCFNRPCGCDDYPVPAHCQADCPMVLSMVKSINPANNTATIEIERNGVKQQREVSLKELPPMVKRGARISTLLKVDPSTGKFTFKRVLPDAKPPALPH